MKLAGIDLRQIDDIPRLYIFWPEKRSTFRKEFTGEEWGQSKYYNLSIDTTHLSYQQAADLILYYKKLAEEAQK